ncbi:MAG: ZmpA/ZmpB/ZmpC family metallo-endopeptidase-related protein [Prevotellaceae bacterium]|nr:ZmpA/ZmpB/ZmpC family metallo-endopeptidase-related protein [Prevotellaceae bacterium]
MPKINAPTVNSSAITFTHTNISGTFAQEYDDYIFYNGTHHYWYDNQSHTSVPETKSSWTGVTYTWSIVEGGSYAQINSSGVLTFNNNVPTTPTTIKVRLTTSNIAPMTDKTDEYTLTATSVPALNETVYSDMTITPSSATIDLNGSQSFTVPASIDKTTRTRAAYVKITAGSDTYSKVGDTYQQGEPQVNENKVSYNATGFNWQFNGEGYADLAPYYTEGSTPVTVTRSSQLTASGKTLELSVTGHYATPIGDKTATANITIPFTLIDLRDLHAGTSITMNIGETTTIVGHYTYEPNYDSAGKPYINLTYSSADESIATIDENGNIKGVGVGETTITIQSKRMDDSNGPSCAVTVTVKDACATPTVLQDVNSFIFMCSKPSSGAIIYYTTDGSEPSRTHGTAVAAGVNVTTLPDNSTIKAIATANGYYDSGILEYYYSKNPTGNGTAANPYLISCASHLKSFANMVNNGNAGAYYKVTANFSVSDYTTPTTDFTGTFDGDFFIIDGLTQPLVGNANGATIKNVILDNVTISRNGDVGAIACQASGNARIYNCGVLATGSTFSYDQPYTSSSTIECTKNGSSTGSIVGYINGNTRVANCFSYADVESSGNAGGIVGYVDNWIDAANKITNGTNTFVMNCMFYGYVTAGNRSPVVFGWNVSDTYSTYNYFRYKSFTSTNNLRQNGTLAAQEDMWLKRFKFFQSAVTNHRDLAAVYIFNDASRINDIAQWYIDEEIAPWPILRKAEKRRSTLDRVIPNTGNANEGNLITNGNILKDEGGNVIDEDVTQRYNMNVGSGGYLAVNFDINGSSYSANLPITDMDFEHYDYTWGKVVLPFANEFDGWTRDYDYICTGWEITSVTGGTTGTLTDYNFADRNCTAKDIYNATDNPIIFAQGGNYIVPYGVTAINVKAHFAKAYYLADATYDCTGNKGNTFAGNRPANYNGKTVYTSVQNAWAAMSAKSLPHDQALVLVGNYHYNSSQSQNYTGKGCTIMSIDEDCDQQPDYGWYSSVGSYRADWMPIRWDFIPLYGFNMVQTNTAPPGIAIPVAKGWYEMTETTICRTYEFESNDAGRSSADNGHSNNAYIINGGYFQQIVRSFNDGTHNKLSYMKVGGNAYVKEFFHGNHSGTTRKWTVRPIIVTGGEINQCFMTGMGNKNEIVTTDNNVRFYCAGGKIDKYLSAYNGYPVVNATMKVDHARIGRFFGGGTSPKAAISGNIDIVMDNSTVDFFCGGPEFGDMGDGKTVTVSTTGSTFGEYYGAGFGGTALTRITNGDGKNDHYDDRRLNYDGNAGGFEVSYEMEALLQGNGAELYRYYDYRADLSMAAVGPTTTTAEKCHFLNSFYGGGCQGKVNGTITSTLTDCDVNTSAFGGGYKAATTTIDVYPIGGYTWQAWDGTYKAFSDPVYPTPVQFIWAEGRNGTYNEANKILYTNADMTQMGRVTGAITLTIDGGTVGQNVYGGGNESPSDDAAMVVIKGNAQVGNDAFGGGNIAPVGKDVSITLGVAGVTDADQQPNVEGALYGGGALANTNTTSGNTTVNLYGGSVTDVYGGGLGQLADAEHGVEAVEAIVNGNTTVTLDGSVIRGNIFGANNLNGTPKGHVLVDIKTTKAKGTETTGHPYHVLGVYGGGNLAAYTPTNDNDYAEVIIEKCDNSIEDVFGGGNAAAVPATLVTVWGGNIGRVFAGGNGSTAPADVTNNTHAIIHGGTIKEVYGGSNSQGSIGGTITVDIAEQAYDSNPLCPIDIADLYGGGNLAPSNAGQITIGKCHNITRVFGGANQANVNGDITLDIIDGHVQNVFGGNNNSGAINGAITVNVNWGANATSEPQAYLGNVYGGGNLAEYATPSDKTGPTVNIINATIEGNVFGGGLGLKKDSEDHVVTVDGVIQGAIVVGNPIVNIGSWADGSVVVKGNVFGGGDLAAVEGSPTVTVRDCGTLIMGDLYGGGNAAPVYSTNTTFWGGQVNGNIFGGGNGADATKNAKGAQIGYKRDDTTLAGEGIGDAVTNVYGGTIGVWDGDNCTAGGGVFGGSNTNGNIAGKVKLTVDQRQCDETDADDCTPIKLREIYGSGNQAAFLGDGIDFNLGCIEGLEEIYGGSKEADMGTAAKPANIHLIISSGHFKRVFGGNNLGGCINGSIKVSIDETGCNPVIIDELYCGGNQAAYSVYGYNSDSTPKTSGENPYDDPEVEVISCTHIGKVFGGGLGASAKIVGTTNVIIDEIPGVHKDLPAAQPYLNADKLGSIGEVYGGGNEADVVGYTNVKIGTKGENAHIEKEGTEIDTNPKPSGANITGNVYGGGNQADVTGKTNVIIGKKKTE